MGGQMPWGILKGKLKIKIQWSLANEVFSFISFVLVNAFPWNHHLCQWLEESHSLLSFSPDLELQVYLKCHARCPSVDMTQGANSQIYWDPSPSPFLMVLARLPSGWVISFFVCFLSLVPPFFPTPDHLVDYISWLVFLRCFSGCHSPGTGWVHHCR